MNSNLPFPTSPMDPQIFKLNLSVMATSAYILIAAIMASGAKATSEAISARWNASPQELESSLAELKAQNIIQHSGSNGDGLIYVVNPASSWQASGLGPK